MVLSSENFGFPPSYEFMAGICKSCTECPGLRKCSATPDVSERLFIMSQFTAISDQQGQIL